MLFHYHFWTPYVEETEKFYVNQGFRIAQRLGKYQGEFQAFHPPLTWDDFREKEILFRVIEARKGKVNITFGYGRRPTFDHIGFLVSPKEHETFCKNAKKMNWNVNVGERRTFIHTPYQFKIELQVNTDVIDTQSDQTEIEKLKIATKGEGLKKDLAILFNRPVDSIISVVGDKVKLEEAVFKGAASEWNMVDPNGVMIWEKN
ncbi:MAG TPA: hypothetical protein VEV44_03025 [Pseudoneobacillus sp.]|nr:hypothetical protein [Pseudoneobacillus sp.]